MAYETLLTATTDGVLTITLNRPDTLNAFNGAMTDELTAALKTAERDADVRAIVITGAGRAFSSGQDLADLKDQYAPGEKPLLGPRLRNGYNPIIKRICGMEKPVIAAVNGVAAGAGASLALACDLRVASSKASFVEAFVHVGLIPDSGSTWLLPRLVGHAKAMEMCILGDKVRADQALDLGLVNFVVADGDDLAAEAQTLAARLAAMPTRAIGLTKRLLNRSITSTLDEQLEAEAYDQETAGKTDDHIEGVTAFLEKRKPAFKGR